MVGREVLVVVFFFFAATRPRATGVIPTPVPGSTPEGPPAEREVGMLLGLPGFVVLSWTSGSNTHNLPQQIVVMWHRRGRRSYANGVVRIMKQRQVRQGAAGFPPDVARQFCYVFHCAPD